MAQQVINVGTLPDDGTGDTLRATGIKVNANFNDSYARLVNVQSPLYGAIGDGSADDTIAINAAIAAAAATNAVLFFPSGATFRHTSGLVFAGVPLIMGYGATLKPSAAVTTAVTLTALIGGGSLFGARCYGLTIDGTQTTNAVGAQFGTGTLDDWLQMVDMHITGFKGGSGIGFWIRNTVQSRMVRCYADLNDYGLQVFGTAPSLPTTTRIESSHFRTSTFNGALIKNGTQVVFRDCVFEGNGREGAFVSGINDNATDVLFDNTWWEANYDVSHYHLVADGSFGGTCRVQVKGSVFNGSGINQKAIHFKQVADFVLDDVHVGNAAGNILIDGGGGGTVTNWNGSTNGAYAVTVSDPSNVAINTDNRLTLDEAAWLTYTPTYAASGAMTYTAVTTIKAAYKIIGKLMHVSFVFLGTTGGTAATDLTATLPTNIRSKDNNLYGSCLVTTDGGATFTLGWWRIDGASPTSKVQFDKADGTVWTLGANRGVFAQMTFELF